MKRSITLVFLLYSILNLTGQTQMYVLDPDRWWNDDQASIENLDIQIRPIGLYAEVKMAFDVYAANNFLSNTGTPIEFVMEFKMPEEAVFNDSWLWIDEYISKGEIYERNDGTQIYEGIVDRNQDPSILTKHSSRDYSLRIYPLDPDSTRRVQLSYIIPFEFENREAYLDIPYNIFDSSADKIENTSVMIINTDNWFHYEPNSSIYNVTESENIYSRYQLTNFSSGSKSRFSFMPSDMSKNYYFGRYDQSDEQFFQLVFFPEIDTILSSSYHLILLDFEQANSITITEATLLNQLESSLSKILGENDYFNICYSSFVTRFSFNNWAKATTENISSAIENIQARGIDKNSKLDILIPESLNFIEEGNEKAKLNIVSNSTDYYRENEAEEFLDNVEHFIQAMNNLEGISIMDYASRNRSSWYINGERYTGNEYMYEQLCAKNNGLHFSDEYNDNLSQSLETMLSPEYIFIDEYNLDINSSDGFTYSSYVNIFNDHKLNLNNGIHITGKYIGDYPFEFKFQGLLGQSIINEVIDISRENSLSLNNMASKVWHSQFLLNNEYKQDAESKLKVIETSMEENLLCARTVFLCLEPDSTATNTTIVEGSEVLISTQNVELSDSEFTLYPNPFTENFTIKISSDQIKSNKDTRFELISSHGKIVIAEEIEFVLEGDYYIYKVDLNKEIQAGMYIVRIINDTEIYNKKIIYLK